MSKLSASRYFHKQNRQPLQNFGSERYRLALLPGLEVFVFTGNLLDPFRMDVVDDTECIHISYWLKGSAKGCFDDNFNREFVTREATGNIGYGPGRKGVFTLQGEFCHLTILINKNVYLDAGYELIAWEKIKELTSGSYFKNGFRGAEFQIIAQQICSAVLLNKNQQRPSLWFIAKCLEMISLFLESDTSCIQISGAGQQDCLLKARDILLADLTQPPTIAELSRATGLSVQKLKQGFKHQFGLGVYGVYQKERMQQAYQLLKQGNISVIAAASEIGYSNPSHFAAAFKKEFGLNPGEVKRGIQVFQGELLHGG